MLLKNTGDDGSVKNSGCHGCNELQGVWRVFTPGPATFGGRSLLWGLAVSRAFGDLLMKESNVKICEAVVVSC